MKVLWLCNIMLPFIAQSLGQRIVVKEGWISGLADKVIANKADNNITLAIAFPSEHVHGLSDDENSLFIKDTAREIDYYIFREDVVHPENYDEAIEKALKAITDDFKPDLVHVFGTEYPHTLALAKSFEYPQRILVAIQGVCEECARAYMADLPVSVQKKRTFRDIIRKDSLSDQQRKFEMRAENEKQALMLVGNVTGRTDFDREATRKLAPQAKYYFMNETLRPEFYNDTWNIDQIERHSLFISQGNYPIKGLHYVLEILRDIVDEYDDAMLYVAGDIITANRSIKDRIKISGYGKYLLGMIKKNGLEKNVKFLGRMQSGRMCARYLKTHVFVCPSAIENSPNSVGEAMLLGVPVVASDVGGVHNLINNNSDGFLYRHDKPQQLKEHILNIFKDDKLAMSISSNARIHASKTHDADKNYRTLIDIYNDIVDNGE